MKRWLYLIGSLSIPVLIAAFLIVVEAHDLGWVQTAITWGGLATLFGLAYLSVWLYDKAMNS